MSLTTNPLFYRSETQVYASTSVLPVTASTTLSQSQSSSLVAVTSGSANIVITLPPLLTGLNFKIYLAGTSGTNTVKVLCNNSATVLSGIFGATYATTPQYAVATGGVDASFSFKATCLVGDSVDLFCDGTYWYARGFSAVASATIPWAVATS